MQIVGYAPRATEPATVRIAEAGEVREVCLEPGVEIHRSLGDRHCAGTVVDGRHVACDAPSAPYCNRHADRWPCARCTGNCDMPLDACHEEHAVYIAAFPPDAFKVGVTRSWRLEERLREQGAARAAHLRTVADGRVARQIEAEIAADVGDRVRVATKVAGLHLDIDEEAWEGLLADFGPVETFAFDDRLDLVDQPVPETLLSGTVVGVIGRVLVLDNGGTTYAVNLRDLVGHDVESGGRERDLQSSLGAFE